uniref:Uncharacterized protein LOC117356901 isoform X2 n=1 Tax=Geotrypetes seraphini TaxID=260995 RepID=A0A6P8QAH6_GEOSA|nr:uncharacterized protein LOC117356901 isoform X2 [Geotrypetes seraphini]
MWFWLLAFVGFYFLFRWYWYRQILQNLTDKYVFITGCDSGFGNLLARQLDEQGLRVLAACLTQRGTEQLKEATSQRLQTIILDVTDSENVAAAASWVKQQVGDRGLWGLVNNAGIGSPVAPNGWLTKNDFCKILNVNLVGMIDVTLSLLPLIRKSKGRIVNVSSIVGRISMTGGGYSISKYGVEAFSDSLSRERQNTTMWFWLLAFVGFYFLFRWYWYRQILQNLTDKYVFITGCDSGFGNLLARQLDEQGLRVLAACLTQRGTEQLKEATSQRLQTIILDVTNSENVAAVASWVKQQVGDRGLWGLVNNAGIASPIAPNGWLTKNDFCKVLNVNLVGMIDVTLSLLPLIRKAKGRIVNVSSAAGRLSLTGGGYNISKYGVEAFSDSLRRELCSFGVKVCIIEPGAFKTHITDPKDFQETIQQIWSCLPEETKESYGKGSLDIYFKAMHIMVDIISSKLSLEQRSFPAELSCETENQPRRGWGYTWEAASSRERQNTTMWFWLLVIMGFYFLFRWYWYRQILQNLTDKYVFITGCDSGFGNLLARQLDEQGLRVLAACLTQRGTEQLKEATSQRLQTVILDVTDSENVAAAASWVKQQVGDRGLWGLVNNAGISSPIAPNGWLTKNDFCKVLNVNLVGMIDVTLSLLPLIRKAKGRIVNVSSGAGRLSLTGGGYSISKYGVEAFSDSLRFQEHA